MNIVEFVDVTSAIHFSWWKIPDKTESLSGCILFWEHANLARRAAEFSHTRSVSVHSVRFTRGTEAVPFENWRTQYFAFDFVYDAEQFVGF